MTTTAAESWVADLYDTYVTASDDIPFFLEEARETGGPILELMAGTGRVTLPLARAGHAMTCVDIAEPMLARLRAKLVDEGLKASIFAQNIADLDLPQRDFSLAILPFQSFAELLTQQAQQHALMAIARHLRPGGLFVCTLHNPSVRRHTIDGQLRLIGSFPVADHNATLMLWVLQFADDDAAPVVRVLQLYELYGPDGRMMEKYRLEVRFRLLQRAAFEELAAAAGFRMVAILGDYDRTPFDETTSPYMIWVLIKE